MRRCYPLILVLLCSAVQAQDAAGLRKDLFAALAIVYGDLAAAAADGVPEEALETVSLDAVLDRFAAARTVPDGVT